MRFVLDPWANPVTYGAAFLLLPSCLRSGSPQRIG